MDERTGLQVEQSMQSHVKKHTDKTIAKKQKRPTYIQTDDGISSTITTTTQSTTSNEQYLESGQKLKQLHEQSTVNMLLLNATQPAQSEPIQFDEQTTNIEHDTITKQMHLKPIYQASNTTQTVDSIEHIAHIQPDIASNETCVPNVIESLALNVIQVEHTDNVDQLETEKAQLPSHVAESLVIDLAAAASETILPMENIDRLLTPIIPSATNAERTCVPFESAIVAEQMANIREGDLNVIDLTAIVRNIASETVITQQSLQVHEIDAGECEENISETYQPNAASANLEYMPNQSLAVDETISHDVPEELRLDDKCFEEATTSFVTNRSYQMEEVCVAETGDKLPLDDKPEQHRVNIKFSDKTVVAIEQTNVVDSEAPLTLPKAAAANATDAIDLQDALISATCQPMDTFTSTEQFTYEPKAAIPSIQEKTNTIVSVEQPLDRETPLEITVQASEQLAKPNYTTHESVAITEIEIQENNGQMLPIEPQMEIASKSQVSYETCETNKQEALESTEPFTAKPQEQAFNVAIDFEAQKSTVEGSAIVFESEQPFDTKTISNEPKYSIESDVKRSLVISEAQPHETDSNLLREDHETVRATAAREPHRSIENKTEQTLDTTDIYRGSDRAMTFNAQIDYELQKHITHETLEAHDSEHTFETNTMTITPTYTLDESASIPIQISEAQPYESDCAANIKSAITETAIRSEQPYNVNDYGDEQLLDTVDETADQRKNETAQAGIQFELHNTAIDQITLTHELEQTFDTDKMPTTEPKYVLDAVTNSSISISETEVLENDASLTIEQPMLASITSVHEPHRAIEASAVHPLDTATLIPVQSTETGFTASPIVESQKLAITSTVQTHEAEQSFEASPISTFSPEYRSDTSVGPAIGIVEQQVLHSEDHFDTPSHNEQTSNASDVASNISHTSLVVETTLLDSTQSIEAAVDNRGIAKLQRTPLHEISVETTVPTETVDQLSARVDGAQMIAHPDVSTQNALNVAFTECEETVADIKLTPFGERKPTICKELEFESSLNVSKVETTEESQPLNIDETTNTATADVFNVKCNEMRTEEIWSVEETDVLEKPIHLIDQINAQHFTECTALTVTSTLTTDTLDDLTMAKAKEQSAKQFVDAKYAIYTQDTRSNENAADFTEDDHARLLAKGTAKQEIDMKFGYTQTEPNALDAANEFGAVETAPLTIDNSLEMHVLPVASVSETDTNLHAVDFTVDTTKQHLGKISQEGFNKIGEVSEVIVLESERQVENIAEATIERTPKSAIETNIPYTVYEEHAFEKENYITQSATDEVHIESSSHILHTATNVEEVVGFDKETESKPFGIQSKDATQNLEEALSSIQSSDVIVHEQLTLLTETIAKMVSADFHIEPTECIQIEESKPLDSEKAFEHAFNEENVCKQSLEGPMKTAIVESTEPIEQTGKTSTVDYESVRAHTLLDESNQNVTQEQVYITNECTADATAQQTIEKPNQTVKIIEQYPLHKESELTNFTYENILTLPKITMQESSETVIATKERQIQTQINAETDVKHVTNQKKLVKKSHKRVEKGR